MKPWCRQALQVTIVTWYFSAIAYISFLQHPNSFYGQSPNWTTYNDVLWPQSVWMGVSLQPNTADPSWSIPFPAIPTWHHADATNDLQRHFERICALQSDITFDFKLFHSETISIDKAFVPIPKLDDEDQQIDAEYGGNGRTKWTESAVVWHRTAWSTRTESVRTVYSEYH